LRRIIKSFASQAATNASVAADPRDDRSSAKEIDVAETNEDPLAVRGEDPVIETGKASVDEARKACVVETREDSVAETGEDHPVVIDFENPQELGQELGNGGVEAAASAASSVAGSFQMFAAEATDYSKKSLENGSDFIEKLLGAKSLESAIQIQNDYAKSAYAEFVAYLVKMSDLYCNFFERGSTPIEKAAAKIEGVKA
jgi:Phasin protein